jgi:hypothetical protein
MVNAPLIHLSKPAGPPSSEAKFLRASARHTQEFGVYDASVKLLLETRLISSAERGWKTGSVDEMLDASRLAGTLMCIAGCSRASFMRVSALTMASKWACSNAPLGICSRYESRKQQINVMIDLD